VTRYDLQKPELGDVFSTSQPDGIVSR